MGIGRQGEVETGRLEDYVTWRIGDWILAKCEGQRAKSMEWRVESKFNTLTLKYINNLTI